MKKILLLLFILTISTVYSQQLENFTAKDGYPTAITKATTSGITNPALIFVGTLNAGTETIPYPNTFDYTEGTASFWIYIIREASDTNITKCIVVTKLKLMGYQSVEVPLNTIVQLLPTTPQKAIQTTGWIDTDVMMTEFKNNGKVDEYFQAHSNPAKFMFFLMILPDNPLLSPNEPYWVMSLVDNTVPLVCAINAITLDVVCDISLSALIKITAREGYYTARTKAIEDGITTPQLVAIATMKQTTEEIPISNEFDFTNGTSKYWIYLFTESNDTSIKRCYVLTKNEDSEFYCRGLEPDFLLSMIEIELDYPIDIDNWIDSDVMISTFLNHSYFNDFYEEHPNPLALVIGLFKNDDNPDMPANDVYWGVGIYDQGDSLFCVMQAVNKTIYCGEPGAVDDNNHCNCSMTLHPNPSKETVYLTLNIESLSSDIYITISDLQGRKLNEYKEEYYQNSAIPINIKDYEDGVYFIKVNVGLNTFAKKLIINN